jgi:hypothetical protein
MTFAVKRLVHGVRRLSSAWPKLSERAMNSVICRLRARVKGVLLPFRHGAQIAIPLLTRVRPRCERAAVRPAATVRQVAPVGVGDEVQHGEQQPMPDNAVDKACGRGQVARRSPSRPWHDVPEDDPAAAFAEEISA